MQAAGTGADNGHRHALRFHRRGGGAVPQARTAVDAFLLVEGWHDVSAEGDGLAGTNVDAQLRALALPKLNPKITG